MWQKYENEKALLEIEKKWLPANRVDKTHSLITVNAATVNDDRLFLNFLKGLAEASAAADRDESAP